MAELLETFMVLAFGVSWPISIYKSYTSKTAKGKSLAFLLLIYCVFKSLNSILNLHYKVGIISIYNPYKY